MADSLLFEFVPESKQDLASIDELVLLENGQVALNRRLSHHVKQIGERKREEVCPDEVEDHLVVVDGDHLALSIVVAQVHHWDQVHLRNHELAKHAKEP